MYYSTLDPTKYALLVGFSFWNMEIEVFQNSLDCFLFTNGLILMKAIVTYIDNTNEQVSEILVKEYSSLEKAYIPENGKVIVVYSELEHDHIEFKVTEVRVLIDREFDNFDVLLERTN